SVVGAPGVGMRCDFAMASSAFTDIHHEMLDGGRFVNLAAPALRIDGLLFAISLGLSAPTSQQRLCHTGVTAQTVIRYPQCRLSACETACGRPSAELALNC